MVLRLISLSSQKHTPLYICCDKKRAARRLTNSILFTGVLLWGGGAIQMMDIKEVDVNKSTLLRRYQAKIYHNKSCRYRLSVDYM